MMRLAQWQLLNSATVSPEPAPPPEIAEVERYLATDLGFTGSTLRTDYGFVDAEQAAVTCGFFFGEEFAARVRTQGWSRVPECTGIWVLGT